MGDLVGSSDDLNQPLNDRELDLLQLTFSRSVGRRDGNKLSDQELDLL